MNCEQVQESVHRFYDGELSHAERVLVQTHLDECSCCREELSAIAGLSQTFMSLSKPEPPATLWAHIAEQLVTIKATQPASARRTAFRWRAAVVAALLLVAVTSGWLAYHSSRSKPFTSESRHATVPVVDLDPFLGPQFSIMPAQGERMRPQDAARQVTFRVVTTPNLPDGYSLKESYLVRIEGCNVVQHKYLRGSDIALLLQYSQGQPVSYGGRPVVAVERINGKPVEIVQGEGHLAASWKANGTAVSLVGPRSRSDLVRLVAFVDSQLREENK